jgi:predicted alpha/beta-fold hydrolase
MCRLGERMVNAGNRVFRMDMRGCGAGLEVARKPTHCGCSDDVGAAVRYITNHSPVSPIFVVGFSLGGALALKLLAEIGDEPLGNLNRVLAVCPPLDLFAVEKQFDTPLGRPYDRFFVRLIWRQVLARWDRFPDIAPMDTPQRPRRLKHIDEMVIAPAAGYTSADEYYAATQVGPSLASIRQPATIIAAEDDPIVPIASLYEYERSECVEPIVVKGGGHLGFIASSNGDPDYRWLDWRILEWVQSSVQSPMHVD